MEVDRRGVPSGGPDTVAASGCQVGADDETPPRNRSGELVADRYRIVRRLGEGGMGAVWLAVDHNLPREVALKELKQRYLLACAANPEGSVLQEARAASAVLHPGVVQVYDVVVSGGVEWIVMEALSGITLTRAIRDSGSLPLETLVPLGLRLVEALHAIHSQGVVHGDIKPCNVQLPSPRRPVLTDFGLASRGQYGEGTRPYGAGTPSYMAPETIRTGVRTPASDLFALGATLYEAAEGRRPFHGGTPDATAIAVLHTHPRTALQGSPLGHLIDGLLAKDVRHRSRHQDVYARLLAIESQLVGAETVDAPPAPPSRS